MPRRDDLAGTYNWSLRFTSAEGSAGINWSLAGCKYRVGLPELVHLEHGSFIQISRVEQAIDAAHVFYDISKHLRCQ